MKSQTRRTVACSLMAFILLFQLSIHFSHYFCPVHAHHSRDTAESHIRTGPSDCLCFFMSFCPPCFEPLLLFERAFGGPTVQAEGRPLSLEIFKIFHPPLSS